MSGARQDAPIPAISPPLRSLSLPEASSAAALCGSPPLADEALDDVAEPWLEVAEKVGAVKEEVGVVVAPSVGDELLDDIVLLVNGDDEDGVTAAHEETTKVVGPK